MYRGLFVVILLLLAPCAHAQWHFYGNLGIYDDLAHTQDFGTMDPGFKTIYVGVDLTNPSWLNDLLGLEFSIAGLDDVFLLGIQIQPTPYVVIGDVHAPADTVSGSGGLMIAWNWLIPDSSVSIALQIVSGAPPVDHVFRVLRRFPSTFMDHPYPLAMFDNGLVYLRIPLIGGTYTLNPTVATESRTWSTVKHLFRSP